MTAFVDDYVRQVEAACADLPPDQRRRLVADLAAHLHEIDTHVRTPPLVPLVIVLGALLLIFCLTLLP